MESILGYLDKIEDILEECRSVPFSGKVSVDKESIYEVIDEIRLNLPTEIRQAQRIVADCDKILNDARSKSSTMLRDAEVQVERLIHDNEITKKANEQAAKILEDSKQAIREMHINAREYADEILEKSEKVLRQTMMSIVEQCRETEDFLNESIDVIYSNRQELRGARSNKQDF